MGETRSDTTRRSRSSTRASGAWADLVDPPGTMGTGGAEAETFTTPGGAFQTGLWRREPDTWSFERPYDEVALILAGEAEIETDGRGAHRARRRRARDAEGVGRHLAHHGDDREVLRDLRRGVGAQRAIARTVRWTRGRTATTSRCWWRRGRPGCFCVDSANGARGAASAGSGSSWFTPKPLCPVCDLRFESEEGGFLGAMVLNYAFAVSFWLAALAHRDGADRAVHPRRAA